jgi:hypothetical protein
VASILGSNKEQNKELGLNLVVLKVDKRGGLILDHETIDINNRKFRTFKIWSQ